MSETMTPKQALIMWCLLGRHGWAFQKDIVPKVDAKDREALASGGYITSAKPNRSYILTVEDKGWRWASEHLRDKLPPNFQILQNWLERVDDFLKRNRTTFAEFIGP